MSATRWDDYLADEARAERAARALAQFDQLLAGEEPSCSAQSPTASAPDEPALWDDPLADVCRFLLAIEEVWPRGADETGRQGPASDVATPYLGIDPADADGAQPQRLGRFAIIKELGRGGFGIVFLAVDPVTERQVALKVPRPEALVTPQLKHRFLREARAAASLNHPSIVGMYEAGTAGPVCYLASAYSPGTNLAAWLDHHAGPVPARVAATMIALLADAVQHAHSRGVLHRDIKPSNVLLETLADGQTCGEPPLERLPFVPKLCDFGLAKLDRRDAPESLATRAGEMLGTPAYMAPEQVEGRAGEWAHEADVYALGAILYELLTGRAPHVGANCVEVLRRIVENPVVDPRRLRPEVDRDLAAVCLKCLEQRPADRYASAAALAEDLQHYLAGLPVQARPVPAAVRLVRWARRKPTLAAVSVALALALALGFSGVVWQWRRAEAGLEAMRAERQRAEEHWLEENRLVSELFRASEDDKPDRRPLLRAASRQRLLERYRAIVAQPAGGSYTPQEIATACTKFATVLRKADPEYANRIELVNQGLAIWRQLAAADAGNRVAALGLADGEIDAASVLVEASDLEGAAEHADRAAATLLQPEFRDSPFEEERYRLGVVFRRIAEGWRAGAAAPAARPRVIVAYRRAADYWRSLLAQSPDNNSYLAELARCLGGIAAGEARLSNWQAAIAAEREALHARQRCAASDTVSPYIRKNVADTYIGIGNLYEKVPDKAAAIAAFRNAQRVLLEVHAMETTRNNTHARAETANQLGLVYDSLGDPARAAEQFAIAVECYRELGDEFPESRSYRRHLALAIFWLARMKSELNHPQADELFQRACRAARSAAEDAQALPDDRGHWARCQMIFARYLRGKSETARAREEYAKAAELFRELLIRDPANKVIADSLAEAEAFQEAATP